MTKDKLLELLEKYDDDMDIVVVDYEGRLFDIDHLEGTWCHEYYAALACGELICDPNINGGRCLFRRIDGEETIAAFTPKDKE